MQCARCSIFLTTHKPIQCAVLISLTPCLAGRHRHAGLDDYAEEY